MIDVDRTIDDLVLDLRPVRRLASPLRRASIWLGLVGVFGVAVCFWSRPDISRMAGAPDVLLSTIGSLLTAVLAAVAAFELSVPGSRNRWALLPVPGALLWLGASGWGCLSGVGAGLGAADPAECLRFIVVLSIPLSLTLGALLRKACPMSPGLAAGMAGLAAASASATLLPLVHTHDAGALDFAAHFVAVALVVGANRCVGGAVLARTA